MKSTTLLALAALLVLASSARLLQHEKPNLQSHIKLNSLCKNWDETMSTCIECYEGCTKWENICVRIVKYCAKWDDEGNCVECEEGYGSDTGMSINGTCPKKQDQGQGGPIANPPSVTDQNRTIDINCQCHNDDRVCIDCFPGYFLDVDAFCQELPENCTAADPLGNCTACISGFVVEDGSCVPQECDLSLCATFNRDQTECTSCPNRSYLQDGCCIQVNGFCEEWVETTGVCTKCYVGYEINENNNKECVPVATQ